MGQSQNIPLTLSLTGIAQTVRVKDDPTVVNLSTQQTAGLVDERQVKELPLNGRSYDELITLNPATVNYTAQRSGSVGTSNSSVGNMFAVSGRRPQDNIYLLNGVEYTGASLINVTPGGTSGQLLGVEAVREFKRHHRHLLGCLRQAPGSPSFDRDCGGGEPMRSTRRSTSSCATPSSTRAITSTRLAFPGFSATISTHRWAGDAKG